MLTKSIGDFKSPDICQIVGSKKLASIRSPIILVSKWGHLWQDAYKTGFKIALRTGL